MNYYKGNGLYEYLEQHNCQNFYFVKGDMWWLIYGDKKSNPKLLVLACAVTDDEYRFNSFSKSEERASKCLDFFAEQTGLPKLVVRFSGEADEIVNVKIKQDEEPYKEITLKALKDVFAEKGLDIPIGKGTTHKYLNTETSSAYHDWQSAELGGDITVCDLDLVKWKQGKPLQIYELKRSYYDLDEWTPFTDDYANFSLVSKFAKRAGMRFQIVYNVRTKKPFFDDVSRLKLFDFDHQKKDEVRDLGIVRIEDFVQ